MLANARKDHSSPLSLAGKEPEDTETLKIWAKGWEI